MVRKEGKENDKTEKETREEAIDAENERL